MTGTLILPDGRRAAINTDWQADDPTLEQALRSAYPIVDVSPADGAHGAAQLRAAAAGLDGTIIWSDQPGDDGVVY